MVANVTGHRKQGHVPSLPLLCPPAVHPVLGDVWALGFHLHLLGILEKLGRQPGLRRAPRALCVTELRGHSLTAAGGRAGAVLAGAGGAWALSLPCAIILEGGGTGPGGVACLTLMLACSSRTVEPHS